MSEKERAELEMIHSSVVETGRFAHTMLSQSLDVLESGNVENAEQLLSQKQELKTRIMSIEESMFQYIALYQPMARDMRELVASIRIIYNFERIGRMGSDIAETVSFLADQNRPADVGDLLPMGRMVLLMIDDAITAFSRRDISGITSMRDRDKIVDNLYCTVLRSFIQNMEEDKNVVPVMARYVIIDRYLERCGDQACNISEMTVYMVSGERIEIN